MTVYPLRATSAGDAESRLIAQEAFIAHLWTDPRVEAAYQAWRLAFGLDALIHRHQQATDAESRDRVREEFLLRYAEAGSGLRAALGSALAELPPLPWLGERLAAAFLVDLANEFEPQAVRVQTRILVSPAATRGRRAKGGAERVRRDVAWFCRVHVQCPAESVRALAREYIRQGRLPVVGDARSTVQDGIASARRLLE